MVCSCDSLYQARIKQVLKPFMTMSLYGARHQPQDITTLKWKYMIRLPSQRLLLTSE